MGFQSSAGTFRGSYFGRRQRFLARQVVCSLGFLLKSFAAGGFLSGCAQWDVAALQSISLRHLFRSFALALLISEVAVGSNCRACGAPNH